MARFWAPLKQPNKSQTRSRSTVNPGMGSAPSQFGQRPLFSEPGPDQMPPEEGKMPSEMKPDDVSPSDGRLSAEGVAEVAKDAAFSLTPHHTVDFNVANPPTDAQIRSALGLEANLGDTFIIRDGGGANLLWLIVRGGGDSWYYGSLTKAV